MSGSSSIRKAFSYIRFSSTRQAEGGSLDRQTGMSAAYCKRKGLELDESLNLRDLGVSAFRGDNVRDGALAGFLEACRVGRVPQGSVLIVESLDRLSRDQIRAALQLLFALQDYGITIVTLQPEREYPPDDHDALALIEPLIVFARAHEESAMKSHRRKDGWRQARDKARQGGGPMIRICPAWLEVSPDGFRVKEAAAAAVRRIFDLARDGLGVRRIAERLTREGVSPIGNGGRWLTAYVFKILTSPAAMGTYQPHREEGKRSVPDGDPIPNLYPAVVTEAEWLEVQAAISGRGNGRGAGRKGEEETNLFTGLLRCALTGSRLHIVHALAPRGKGRNRGERGRGHYVYLRAEGTTGTPTGARIDYAAFETAVLSRLRELKPSDVVPDGKATNGRKAEVARLSGRLLDIDSRLERAQQRARTASDFDAFLDLIQALQAERKGVVERLAELGREEDGRSPADLGEAQSLIGLLEQVPSDQRADLRRRLKGRIRALVEDGRVLIVRRGMKCLCAIQLWFRGGDRQRSYLLWHKAADKYHPEDMVVYSFADVSLPGDLDLRNESHARQLEADLLAFPLANIPPARTG
jgi:DNA invertase Pin-like site-specific DNA recombinase